MALSTIFHFQTSTALLNALPAKDPVPRLRLLLTKAGRSRISAPCLGNVKKAWKASSTSAGNPRLLLTRNHLPKLSPSRHFRKADAAYVTAYPASLARLA